MVRRISAHDKQLNDIQTNRDQTMIITASKDCTSKVTFDQSVHLTMTQCLILPGMCWEAEIEFMQFYYPFTDERACFSILSVCLAMMLQMRGIPSRFSTCGIVC